MQEFLDEFTNNYHINKKSGVNYAEVYKSVTRDYFIGIYTDAHKLRFTPLGRTA